MIKKRSQKEEIGLENAVLEVSFGPNKPVTVRVIELKVGSKVDARPRDIVIIDGRREFVIEKNLGSLSTICYEEDGKILEGKRVLNNGTIYDLHHYTHFKRYHPDQREYRKFKDVLDNLDIK
jgi:hypothetical protein